ncbi:MAG: phage holin family protein [Candidatus Peribacteria bacterium]|nr:MAG: phage holin family protein [Candidatus Peribacteria bacterium]
MFLTLGGVFWIVYDVIRQILKKLTIPFNWLSFGILHIVINILMLYLFGAVINELDLGVSIQM